MDFANIINGFLYIFTKEFAIMAITVWIPAIWNFWPLILGLLCLTIPSLRCWILGLLKLLFKAILKEFFQNFEERLMSRMDNDAKAIKEDITDLKVDVKNIEDKLIINTTITMDAAKIQIKEYCNKIMAGEQLSPLELSILKRLYSHYKMLNGNGELEEEYHAAIIKLKLAMEHKYDQEYKQDFYLDRDDY